MIGLTINRTADLTPSEPQSRAFTAGEVKPTLDEAV